MTKVDHSTSFYKKMAELQEKLKRSEEERMKLEEKFTLMMKSCRDEEEKRIRALRERYEKFLEDDKRRRDRNERILQILEKIESRAAALSAKSERLKLLRKHYEAYLIRMYPVWKKQSSSASQQTVPTHYPLSLPMETEKGSPWFGSANGLYMNNMPLLSTRSSLSPGSDQLWVPPALSTNIPVYDNMKQSIVHKPVERKGSVVETCSPAIEGALDNYIQRAAELLRVPVEELEGQSEKRDEEKSVHTEQDTSRDLLNVSLSDDSILLEKKVEKTTENTTIANTKGITERMVEGEKHIPEVDYLAGGDNIHLEQQVAQQSARFHQQDISDLPKIAKGSEYNNLEKNVCDSNLIRPEVANMNENVPEYDYNKLTQQEFLSTDVLQNPELQGVFEETLAISDPNNVQVVSDENIENVPDYHNGENVDYIQEPFSNAAEQDHVIVDASYQDIQQPAPEVQQSSDIQPPSSDINQESPENMELLSYALEQEDTNEEQEYVANMGQSEGDFLEQHTNITPQQYTANQEDTTQFTVASEREQQPTEEIYEENDPRFGGYMGEQPVGIEQNYGSQNREDIEQYEQEQYLDNTDQQYEQYPDNTEQFGQEPYVGSEGQMYDQRYPEQYSNDQYLEHTPQFEESHVDNAEKDVEGQYEVSKDQYEGQYINNQQEENFDQYAAYENSQSPMHTENIDPNYSTYAEGGSEEHNENTQPALPMNADAGDLENVQNIEVEPVGDQVPQEVSLQEMKETKNMLDDQVINNQDGIITDIMQQEAQDHAVEDSVDRMGQIEDQAATTLANPYISSTVDDDSEESSAGFWNPPHHSSIPSVDELAPKSTVVVEDTSESSAESKMDPPDGKPPMPNTVQQFRSLLGVPSEPAGDSALSDQDEVEDQLAALVEDPASSTPAVVESKNDPKIKEEKQMEVSQNVKGGKLETTEPLKTKLEKDSKARKSSESAKPPTRTGLKKPPSLIKVLESDSESLNLDTGAASNVDSDEFDFSTE